MTSPGEIDRMFIDLDTKLTRFTQEFASEFYVRVQDRTPVLTGTLKASWFVHTKKGGFELSNIAVNKEGQPYAAYVEYGTEKMAPRAMIQTTLLEKDQVAQVAKERAGIK